MTILITIVIVFFLIIPLIVALYVNLTSTSDETRRKAIVAMDSLTVTGEVTSVGTRSDGAVRFVGYQYQVEGKTYQGSQKVIQGPVLAKGTTIQVRYSPHQPGVALLAGKGLEYTTEASRKRLVSVVCALLLLIISFITLVIDLIRLFG